VVFRQLESLTPVDQGQLDRLRQRIRHFGRVCVAYSGGVDSALVAAIAQEQLAEGAFAVTGISPALAPHLREEARQQAHWLGIRHQEVMTAELTDPAYATNPTDRCYACKRELHRHLAEISRAAAGAQVLDGVNHDDLGDHRPGIDAAREAGVCSPLAELQIDKALVRRLSKALGFPWWDKPAQPCLASRFPYGEGITASRLSRVAAAERWLQQRHFDHVRVRSQGETARIEVPAQRLAELLQDDLRQEPGQAFLQLGFIAVSLDLEGVVSGKLNRAIQPLGSDA